MIKSIFAIRDVKLSVFHLPFYADSAIQAQRQIKMAMMSDDRIMISAFADDYELYEIGEFEDVVGSITMLANKKFISNMKAIKAQIMREKMFFENQMKQEQEDLKTQKRG